MNKEKLRIGYYASVIIIGLFAIVAFLWVIKHNGVVVTHPDVSSSFLTAISIVVALGIGYSVLNIHDYNNRVQKLSDKIDILAENMRKDLLSQKEYADKEIEQLRLKNIESECEVELEKRNHAVDTMFKKGDILHALKSEFDILCYIFSNHKYISQKFDSHTGSKRSFIANDILICISKVDKALICSLTKDDLSDIVTVILRNIAELRYHEASTKLNQYERERFSNIYNASEQIVKSIIREDFPLQLDSWLMNKLKIYTSIVDGTKPDPS